MTFYSTFMDFFLKLHLKRVQKCQMGTSIVNQFWFYIGFIFFNLEDCKEYYWAKLYQNDKSDYSRVFVILMLMNVVNEL